MSGVCSTKARGCMLPLKRQQPTPEPAKDPEGHMQRVGFLCVLIAMLSAPLAAQVPTGAIAGTVSDRVGAVLPGAAVTVTNKATGASRDVVTASDGTFSVPSLLPGAYDRSEEHTSELQSQSNLVCRLLLEKKKKKRNKKT